MTEQPASPEAASLEATPLLVAAVAEPLEAASAPAAAGGRPASEPVAGPRFEANGGAPKGPTGTAGAPRGRPHPAVLHGRFTAITAAATAAAVLAAWPADDPQAPRTAAARTGERAPSSLATYSSQAPAARTPATGALVPRTTVAARPDSTAAEPRAAGPEPRAPRRQRERSGETPPATAPPLPAPPSAPGDRRWSSRPEPHGSGTAPYAVDRPPSGREGRLPLAAAALARYQAGDIEGALAMLGTGTAPSVAALAARLDAISRLLGSPPTWPPPGGAAAIERILELESQLGLPGPSPIAYRARAELAAHALREGSRLADEARWEEAAVAFRAALEHAPGSPAAEAGLDRVERGLERLYLEAYVAEDEDVDRARRVYQRVLRAARPGGALAHRAAGRLTKLPALRPPLDPR